MRRYKDRSCYKILLVFQTGMSFLGLPIDSYCIVINEKYENTYTSNLAEGEGEVAVFSAKNVYNTKTNANKTIIFIYLLHMFTGWPLRTEPT